MKQCVSTICFVFSCLFTKNSSFSKVNTIWAWLTFVTARFLKLVNSVLFISEFIICNCFWQIKNGLHKSEWRTRCSWLNCAERVFDQNQRRTFFFFLRRGWYQNALTEINAHAKKKSFVPQIFITYIYQKLLKNWCLFYLFQTVAHIIIFTFFF